MSENHSTQTITNSEAIELNIDSKFSCKLILCQAGKHKMQGMGCRWTVLAGYWQTRLKDKHGQEKTVKLHRYLIDAPPSLMVDHINGNPSDNRLENLRLCNNSENQRNQRKMQEGSSKFKGVSKRKKARGWRARIQFDGKDKTLGSFDREIDAASAYDSAARMLYKEFAYTNKDEYGDYGGAEFSESEINEMLKPIKRSPIASRFVGVCWHKAGNKWASQVTLNGKQRCLGLSKTEEEAAILIKNATGNYPKVKPDWANQNIPEG